MPSLGASHAAIVAALAKHYGPPAPTGVAAGLDSFPALVTVLLGRALDPRKAARGCVALADAGLLDPRALAEADAAEIADALKSSGVAVPARALAPIQRLARWFVERDLDPGTGADSLDSIATESLPPTWPASTGSGRRRPTHCCSWRFRGRCIPSIGRPTGS